MCVCVRARERVCVCRITLIHNSTGNTISFAPPSFVNISEVYTMNMYHISAGVRNDNSFTQVYNKTPADISLSSSRMLEPSITVLHIHIFERMHV